MKKIYFVAVSALLFINSAFAQDDMAMRKMISSNCMPDIKKFCADVKPGHGAIIDCLKGHNADLSDSCKTALQTAKDEQK